MTPHQPYQKFYQLFPLIAIGIMWILILGSVYITTEPLFYKNKMNQAHSILKDKENFKSLIYEEFSRQHSIVYAFSQDNQLKIIIDQYLKNNYQRSLRSKFSEIAAIFNLDIITFGDKTGKETFTMPFNYTEEDSTHIFKEATPLKSHYKFESKKDDLFLITSEYIMLDGEALGMIAVGKKLVTFLDKFKKNKQDLDIAVFQGDRYIYGPLKKRPLFSKDFFQIESENSNKSFIYQIEDNNSKYQGIEVDIKTEDILEPNFSIFIIKNLDDFYKNTKETVAKILILLGPFVILGSFLLYGTFKRLCSYIDKVQKYSFNNIYLINILSNLKEFNCFEDILIQSCIEIAKTSSHENNIIIQIKIKNIDNKNAKEIEIHLEDNEKSKSFKKYKINKKYNINKTYNQKKETIPIYLNNNIYINIDFIYTDEINTKNHITENIIIFLTQELRREYEAKKSANLRNRQLGAMAVKINHELNNPLATLLLATEEIQDCLQEDFCKECVETNIKTIENACIDIATKIQDLQRFKEFSQNTDANLDWDSLKNMQ